MREPILMVGIGKKGVGKSYSTERMIESYVKGNPAKGVPARRALILDVNDEYSNIRAIRVEDVPLFSVHTNIEVRRIRPFLDNGNKMSLDDVAQALFTILNTYRNGLLLVEDINKYISDTMPNDLVGAICTNRHIGVDIILHYQSIGRITSKVWQNVNTLRMHKFTDSVKRHKHKYEDKFEFLTIAENIVNRKHEEGDKRFHLYVDIDNEKVYGKFTAQEYELAAKKFIEDNYANLISPLLKSRDEKGRKTYNPGSAIAEVKKRLMSHCK